MRYKNPPRALRAEDFFAVCTHTGADFLVCGKQKKGAARCGSPPCISFLYPQSMGKYPALHVFPRNGADVFFRVL